MPPKSQADILDVIGDLRTEHAVLGAKHDSLRDEVERADLQKVLQRIAVLESQQAESKKPEEEADRRRWQT